MLKVTTFHNLSCCRHAETSCRKNLLTKHMCVRQKKNTLLMNVCRHGVQKEYGMNPYINMSPTDAS